MHYICYVTAAYIDVYLEFPTLSLSSYNQKRKCESEVVWPKVILPRARTKKSKRRINHYISRMTRHFPFTKNTSSLRYHWRQYSGLSSVKITTLVLPEKYVGVYLHTHTHKNLKYLKRGTNNFLSQVETLCVESSHHSTSHFYCLCCKLDFIRDCRQETKFHLTWATQ